MTAQLQSGLISIQAHILGLQTEFPTSCNTYPNLYQMRNNTMSIEQYIKQLEADIKEEALDAKTQFEKSMDDFVNAEYRKATSTWFKIKHYFTTLFLAIIGRV